MWDVMYRLCRGHIDILVLITITVFFFTRQPFNSLKLKIDKTN